MQAQVLAHRRPADPASAAAAPGDSTEPHATTTVGASTVSAVCEPSARVIVASTPVARPSFTSTRSALHCTTQRAPASEASCS